MNAKILGIVVVVGILIVATTAVRAEEKQMDEYSLSPANGIMCTVRMQNPDGTRDAVGTDFSDQRQVSMETLRIYSGGLVHHAWVVDRETGDVSDGDYAVFRKHCAPLMEQLPADLRKRFEGFFAN